MRPFRKPHLALVVMAKAPIPGEAKTRLGATLGHGAAAELYRGFLGDTLEVIERADRRLGEAERLVVCPDARHADRLRSIVGDGWAVLAQRRSGLMGGILDAFEAGLDRGADGVVVTDADSPLALLDHLPDCVALLTDHDLVLGPTLDGGYYLIAARETARPCLPDLLLGERFESATIAAATLRRARNLGLTTGLGPEGFDVDTHAELESLAARLSRGPVWSLRHTRGALKALDWMPNERDARSAGRAAPALSSPAGG